MQMENMFAAFQSLRNEVKSPAARINHGCSHDAYFCEAGARATMIRNRHAGYVSIKIHEADIPQRRLITVRVKSVNSVVLCSYKYNVVRRGLAWNNHVRQ